MGLLDDLVQTLRENEIVQPTEGSSVGEVYAPVSRPAAAIAAQTDAWGAPTVADPEEDPNSQLALLFVNYCRIRKLDKGDEQMFGGQDSAVSLWKVTFPYYLPDSAVEASVPRDAIIRIQKPIRAASTFYGAASPTQPATGAPYWYVCVKAGTTGTDPIEWPYPAAGFDAVARLASTDYAVGETIRVGNARYRATVAGTTASTTPTFPTSALGTVVDGTVTWQLCESVSDGTAVWQVAGRLDEFQVVDDSAGKTYGVMLSCICERVKYE